MNSRLILCIFATAKKAKAMALLLTAALAPALTACDDGRIYEQTTTAAKGKVVRMQGSLVGLEDWPDAYHVAIAGFTDSDAEYASVEKTITANNISDGRLTIELAGLKDEVKNVQLCVLDRLRRHIVTFSQVDVSNAQDTVRVDVGTLDVGMFNAIQQNIFNTTCANCHGAAATAAAGLYLTPGRSYEALVGVGSTKEEGSLIVSPGNAEASVLHKILNTNLSEGWRYNHAAEVTSTDMLTLIDRWIDGLAD